MVHRGGSLNHASMEQVSPASAALLQLESQAAQMHVGWLARVDA